MAILSEEEMKSVVEAAVTGDSDFATKNNTVYDLNGGHVKYHAQISDGEEVYLKEAQMDLLDTLIYENNISIDSQIYQFNRLFYERLVELGKTL